MSGRVVAVLAALVLVLGACGGESDLGLFGETTTTTPATSTSAAGEALPLTGTVSGAGVTLGVPEGWSSSSSPDSVAITGDRSRVDARIVTGSEGAELSIDVALVSGGTGAVLVLEEPSPVALGDYLGTTITVQEGNTVRRHLFVTVGSQAIEIVAEASRVDWDAERPTLEAILTGAVVDAAPPPAGTTTTMPAAAATTTTTTTTGSTTTTTEPVTTTVSANPLEGTLIAFQSEREGVWHIYTIDPEGTTTRRLVGSDSEDGEPAWSPDGTQLAFISTRHGDREIYVKNLEGSGITRLTRSPSTDMLPAWSPDGSRIAFVSARDDNDFEIYVMNADGSDQTRLTSVEGTDFSPVWSPDGTRILFTSSRGGDFDVYVMNADGTGTTRLTTSP